MVLVRIPPPDPRRMLAVDPAQTAVHVVAIDGHGAGGSLAGLSGASLASMATLHGGAGLLNAAGQNQFAGQLGGALGGQNALAASRRVAAGCSTMLSGKRALCSHAC